MSTLKPAGFLHGQEGFSGAAANGRISSSHLTLLILLIKFTQSLTLPMVCCNQIAVFPRGANYS
jgi:hypothetical protein